MEALLAVIAKTDNLVVLVLLLMCSALGYLHIVWRKEEREDRRNLMDTVAKNTDALNGIRIVLSAMTGKPI